MFLGEYQLKHMKKLIALLLFTLSFHLARAQERSRPDIIYTMSGFGFSFPVGETADYLTAKFSNTLGANIALGNIGGLFIYPKVNLHSYRFDQQIPEPGSNYLVKGGRATSYILNVNLGHRFWNGNFSYYGYVGAGGGFVLTHKGLLNNNNIELTNKTNSLATMELGAGMEYKLGSFLLFSEASYLRGFSKLEDRTFAVIPLTVGFKTDLSKLFVKK